MAKAGKSGESGSPMKISKTVLIKEIRERDGNLSEIARRHGMTYNAVHKSVKEDPVLSASLQEVRESLVDEVQVQLGRAVRVGAAWAVKFTLETWGRREVFQSRSKRSNGQTEPR
jgi:hypothetical protein